MKRFLTITLAAMLLGGCAMPTTTVKSVDSRPGIIIAGAPDGALLLVDGITIGKADDYNGAPQVLTVEPGTHRITVQLGGVSLYDQQVFVDSETKTIRVK